MAVGRREGEFELMPSSSLSSSFVAPDVLALGDVPLGGALREPPVGL